MEYTSVYKCLCNTERLRILHLLRQGPLCVCHLMELLETDQVKISKQLRYMKQRGLVQSDRVAQWMIYRLPDPVPPLLDANLRCLQDVAEQELPFRRDLRRRAALLRRLVRSPDACASVITAPVSSRS